MYLVKTSTDFFDGHGDLDEGGTTLELSSNETYSKLKEGEAYIDGWSSQGLSVFKLAEDDDRELSAQDGYNCKQEYYSVKKLTDDEAKAAKKVIDDYNSLLKQV